MQHIDINNLLPNVNGCIEKATSKMINAFRGCAFKTVLYKNNGEFYFACDLPIKPEDGDRIETVIFHITDDGRMEFDYVLPHSAAPVKCHEVCNHITEAIQGAPVQVFYQDIEQKFHIVLTAVEADRVVYALNVLLFVIEGIIIFGDYLNSEISRHEFECACDAITSVHRGLWDEQNMANTFEDFNLIMTDDNMILPPTN